jgi:hypothetical protein
MVLGGPEAHEWLVPKLRLGTQLIARHFFADEILI